MFFLASISILAFLSRLSLAAWDPLERSCTREGVDYLCLTSFVWCNITTTECHFPANTWPRSPGNALGAAIIAWSPTTPYNVTWKNADPAYPVTISWWFAQTIDPDILWSKQYEYNTSVPPPSEYSWDPSKITFPNSISNLTGLAARGGAGYRGGSYLMISQPEKPAVNATTQWSSSNWRDISDFFYPVGNSAIRFAENQVAETNMGWRKKIKLGVGIGVGLGVPILMALTAVITWLFMRRSARQRSLSLKSTT